MRRALLSIVAVGALLVPLSAHGEDYVFVGAGVARCASYAGSVSGGTASVSICLQPAAGVSTLVGSVPSPFAGADWWGCIRVTRTTTHQVCGRPAAPVPLVMDPAMQVGVIDFALSGGGGTLTAKITLTATAAAPVPSYGFSSFCFLGDDEFNVCDVGIGAGVSRAATATGTITSTVRGGGAVSGGSGSLRTSGGGGFAYISLPF